MTDGRMIDVYLVGEHGFRVCREVGQSYRVGADGGEAWPIVKTAAGDVVDCGDSSVVIAWQAHEEKTK